MIDILLNLLLGIFTFAIFISFTVIVICGVIGLIITLIRAIKNALD